MTLKIDMKKFTLFLMMVLWAQGAWATNYCNDASIVACYPAQEDTGTSLIDHSINVNNGTFASSGHPAWTTAAPSRYYLTYSLTYSSSSDYLGLGTTNVFFKPTQTQSFVGWVYPTVDNDGAGFNPRILSRVTGSNQESSFTIAATSTTLFQAAAPTTGLVRTASNNSIILNAWNHIAVTWDGSTTATNVHIYINGTEVGSYQTSQNGVSLQDNTAGILYLGNRIADQARNLNGKLTEMAFFSRVLSSAEINDIYNNGLLQIPTNIYTTIKNAKVRNANII